MAIRLHNSAMLAMCNALTALVDVGGAGNITLYTGAQQADPNTGSPAGPLVTNALSATAFGAAVINGTTAEATAAAITDGVAGAAGNAASFEMNSGAGTPIWTGTVGTAGTDCVLNSVAFTGGTNLQLTSWIIGVRRDA